MDVPVLNFWLNRKKLNKQGLAPIYLRITLNGTRTEVSSKIAIEPKKWDDTSSRVKGKDPLDIRKNKQLNDLTTKVYQALDALQQNRFKINASNLKLAMNGELFQKVKFLNCYEMFIDNLKARVGSDYSEASLELHSITYQQVREFMISSGLEHLALDDFGNVLFQKLEFYLKKTKGNMHNTVYKKIERVKGMLKWAFDMEFAGKDLSRKFKIKKQRKEIIFLTSEELDRIKDIDSVERLNEIRDAFLFMCFTGLGFREIAGLSEDNLTRNIHGGYSLVLTRHKTQKNIPETPLLPQALELIRKYEKHPTRLNKGKLMPVLSNQKFNAYLKEIGALAKIEKPVTTHVGRRTFATTIALKNGMSMEVLSKTLGHSNMRITQECYAELQNERIREEFDKISTKLNNSDRTIIDIQKNAN